MEEEERGSASFSWENRYTQSWDVLREDREGRLAVATGGLDYLSRRRREALCGTEGAGSMRRALMRHTVVLFDWSRAASQAVVYGQEEGPAVHGSTADSAAGGKEASALTGRARWFLASVLQPFCRQYFGENPLGNLCLVALSDGLATIVSRPSPSAPAHEAALLAMLEGGGGVAAPRGDLSLGNGLQLAASLLCALPVHASREVLLINQGLSTIDAVDPLRALTGLSTLSVAVSAVSLLGHLAVIGRICAATGGTYAVSLSDGHFAELILASTTPPVVAAPAGARLKAAPSHLVAMGFPLVASLGGALGGALDGALYGGGSGGGLEGGATGHAGRRAGGALCACPQHSPTAGRGAPLGGDAAYKCPRCRVLVCTLPMDCPVCGLTLISAPHLAKSYHHLFPVPPRTPLSLADGGRACSSCTLPIALSAEGDREGAGRAGGQCSKCAGIFCPACCAYAVEVLYNCPGCLVLV